MEVTLGLLADYANITREGKLNVMGIFSLINAPALPWVHPQMQLVLELEAGPAEWDTQKDIEIKLLDADANSILTTGGSIKVPRGKSGRPVRIHSIMTFGNVKFDVEGDYIFNILIGGETKKQIGLTVNYVRKTPPTVKA
ncbi:hypothetical protein ES703_00447 [subsurface metagenome]